GIAWRLRRTRAARSSSKLQGGLPARIYIHACRRVARLFRLPGLPRPSLGFAIFCRQAGLFGAPGHSWTSAALQTARPKLSAARAFRRAAAVVLHFGDDLLDGRRGVSLLRRS